MIVITAKKEGFRRCGVAHAARPVEWPGGRWTGEELAALLAEPMLTVEVVEDPAPVDPDQVSAAPEPYEIDFGEPAPPLAGADAEADPTVPAAADAETEPAPVDATPAGKASGRRKK